MESYKAQIIETVLISGFQETLKGRKEILVKGYTLPVIRGIRSGDLMYIMVNIINNSVLFT